MGLDVALGKNRTLVSFGSPPIFGICCGIETWYKKNPKDWSYGIGLQSSLSPGQREPLTKIPTPPSFGLNTKEANALYDDAYAYLFKTGRPTNCNNGPQKETKRHPGLHHPPRQQQRTNRSYGQPTRTPPGHHRQILKPQQPHQTQSPP